MIVHHYSERLAQNYGAPHDNVAPAGAELDFGEARDDGQGRLSHHSQESPHPEHLKRDAHL